LIPRLRQFPQASAFLSFCFFFFLCENFLLLLKKIAPGSLIGDDPAAG
jgi:hypothetical protein